MGTFDILNMRMNGYDFHVGLMAGTEKWTDPKTKAVFEKWAELLPYFDPQPLGKTWQEAAQDMIGGKAGNRDHAKSRLVRHGISSAECAPAGERESPASGAGRRPVSLPAG